MIIDLTDLSLPNGIIAVVKQDCPTCQLLVPVLTQLVDEAGLTVYTQDDPKFPTEADWVVDDSDLSVSWHLGLDVVPTLVRIEGGAEVGRATGWNREEWQKLSGQGGLGTHLPAFKPG
jgi:thiol-disulfide isomerase/thioredoxin